MTTALVAIFVLAYAAIALEHPLKVNKSASALHRRRSAVDDLRPGMSGDHHLVVAKTCTNPWPTPPRSSSSSWAP